MKNRNIVIGVVVLAVVAIVAVIFLRPKPAPEVAAPARTRKEIYNFDSKVCPGETVTVKMTDSNLSGLIEEGADVPVVMNYFSCAPIMRDDIVLYRFSEFDEPVLRRVVAIAGDKFDMTESTTHRGWELSVNGKKVRGVKGEVYAFGGKVPPPLKLAVAQHAGRLAKGTAIVFSSSSPGSRDSGIFGVVSVGDIVGKAKVATSK